MIAAISAAVTLGNEGAGAASTYTFVSIVVGAIVIACVWAFFGYVLQLLVAIHVAIISLPQSSSAYDRQAEPLTTNPQPTREMPSNPAGGYVKGYRGQ